MPLLRAQLSFARAGTARIGGRGGSVRACDRRRRKLSRGVRRHNSAYNAEIRLVRRFSAIIVSRETICVRRPQSDLRRLTIDNAARSRSGELVPLAVRRYKERGARYYLGNVAADSSPQEVMSVSAVLGGRADKAEQSDRAAYA